MFDDNQPPLIAAEWNWSGRWLGGSAIGWMPASMAEGDCIAAGAFGWVTRVFAVAQCGLAGYECFWLIRHLPTNTTLTRYGYFASAGAAQKAVEALTHFDQIINWADGARALRVCASPNLLVELDDAVARAVPHGRWRTDDDGAGLQQVGADGWRQGAVLHNGPACGGGEGL